MLESISSALTSLLTMIGSVISSLVTGGETPGALHALLPVFAIGIAIALVGWVVSLIRRLAWGA